MSATAQYRVPRWCFALVCGFLAATPLVANTLTSPADAPQESALVWLGKGWRPGGAAQLKSNSFSDPKCLQGYVKEVAQKLGWNEGALASLRLTHIHDLGYGPLLLRFEQAVDGVPVMPGRIVLLLRRDDYALLAVSGQPVDTSRTLRNKWHIDTAPQLVIEQIQRQYGQNSKASTHSYQCQSDSRCNYQVKTPGPVVETQLQLSIRPILFAHDGALQESYYIESAGTDHSHPEALQTKDMAYVLRADNAKILFSANRRYDLSYQYRVYGSATTGPYSNPYRSDNPHPTSAPTPLATHTYVAQQTVAISHHPRLPQEDPWLPDMAVETVGNNVDAFFALPPVRTDGTWGLDYRDTYLPAQGDFRAPTNANNTFNYTYDPTRASWRPRYGQPTEPVPTSDTQLLAEITQTFFTGNWLHDFFYQYGFTESAGNTQHDNYGRGGIDHDRLSILVSEPTYASSSLDGNPSASIHMENPWDLSVFAHEYMHIVYTRLHGWYPSVTQTRSMNEGWADFIGLLATFDEGSYARDPSMEGAYAIGGYFNRSYLPSSAQGIRLVDDAEYDPYYYGIRRYPYSTDFGKNPLTFRHVELSAEVATTPPYFNWKGRANINVEVHSAGEIWANAVWGCFARLVSAHGATEAKNRMGNYAIAAISLEPPDATYLEARNALLAVIRSTGESDYLLCRTAFASRGMGAGAIAPARASNELHGVAESFLNAEAALTITSETLTEDAAFSDHDGILDNAERGRVLVNVINSGFESLSDTQVTLAPTVAGLITFPSGSTLAIPALNPGQSATLSIPVILAAASPHMLLGFNAQLTSASRGVLGNKVFGFFTHYDWLTQATSTQFADDRAVEDWTIQQTQNRGIFYESEGCWKHQFNLGSPIGRLSASELYGGFQCQLKTPNLTTSLTSDFIMQIEHAYNFEGRGAGWLELSTNGGETWQDVESYIPMIYTGNYFYYPQGGDGIIRRAWIGATTGYPETRSLTLNFGTQLAGQTVLMRFVGNLDSSYLRRYQGWFLHRVAFEGLVAPVFHRVQSDRYGWIFHDGFETASGP